MAGFPTRTVLLEAGFRLFAQARKTTSRPALPLQLSVRTDRQVYRFTDAIKIEVQLLNAGNEDIYLWSWDLCWNPARGLSMAIASPDGFPVSGKLLLDCIPPMPRAGDSYGFVRIEPGQFNGRVDAFKIADLVDKPGEFNVDVRYGSFLSEEFISKSLARDPIAMLPVWTMERPAVSASTIHIAVTPD